MRSALGGEEGPSLNLEGPLGGTWSWQCLAKQAKLSALAQASLSRERTKEGLAPGCCPPCESLCPTCVVVLSPAVDSHQEGWALGRRLQEQMGHTRSGAPRTTSLMSAHIHQQGALPGYLLRRGGHTLPGRPFPSALILQPAQVRRAWIVE